MLPSPIIAWSYWQTARLYSAGVLCRPQPVELRTRSRAEFVRLSVLYLLPKGFVRIRHIGFLANRRCATLLLLCFAALHAVPPQAESEPLDRTNHPAPMAFPKCGGPMVA